MDANALGATALDDTRAFYDDLSRDYHLIYPNWEAEVRSQSEVLDRLLSARCGRTPLRILDCTCGIGTQAIGLALRGHEVVGTDLSEQAVQRAREAAQRLGARAEFRASDVRLLGEAVEGTFDVVMSCHNSIPHLLSRADLLAAVRSMAAVARPGGLVLAGVRDYDSVLADRPSATLPKIRGEAEARRMVFQLWTWHADGLTYDLEHFLGNERGREWSFQVRRVRCRAITRRELMEVAAEAGLRQARWAEPGETGYFEPLLEARTA